MVSCLVEIPEKARYSDNSGAVASITQEGLDYLKVLYLPKIYDEIKDSDLGTLTFADQIL